MVGNFERPRRAGQEQDGEHGLAVEPALHGADGERERGQRLADLADAGDHAAVEQIEHLSGNDRHRDQRKELHEADEAEIERIVGQGVDLPADRHPLHHEGAVGERARAPEQHERAVARQGRVGGGGHGAAASAKGCRGADVSHARRMRCGFAPLQRNSEQRIDQPAVENHDLLGKARRRRRRTPRDPHSSRWRTASSRRCA